MHVEVECQGSVVDGAEPQILTVGERSVDVMEILDRWHDQDKIYFKVKGRDKCTYMLCFDLNDQVWEVTMFERREEIQEQLDSAFRHSFRGKV